MRRYESTIHITSWAENEVDAEERAGRIIDPQKMEPDMVISRGATFLAVTRREAQASDNLPGIGISQAILNT